MVSTNGRSRRGTIGSARIAALPWSAAIAVVLCVSWLGDRAAVAQQGDLDDVIFFNNDMLAPHGLEVAWESQVRLDASKGRVMWMNYFVSEKDGYDVVELTNPTAKPPAIGAKPNTPAAAAPLAETTAPDAEPSKRLQKPLRFSELDLDAFGKPVGLDKSKEAATKVKADLEAKGIVTSLAQRRVYRSFLVIVTDRGIVHCFDGETGVTLWAVSCGNPERNSFPAGIGEKFVAVLNGTSLYVLARDTGEQVLELTTHNVPGAAPAVSSEYVVVPTLSGSVEYYHVTGADLARQSLLPTYVRSTGMIGMPIQHQGTAFAWSTNRGYLYVSEAGSAHERFSIKMSDAAAAPPLFANAETVVASAVDGYVYGVQARTGSILWRFSTGGEIRQAPIPVDNKVYAPLYNGGLFEVDLTSGEEGWYSPGIQQVLALSDDRIFAYDVFDHLTILDKATGQRISRLPIRQVGMKTLNTATDRMFFSTKGGRVVALRTIGADLPIVHRNLGAVPAGSQATAATKPATPVTPAGSANPFGTPAVDSSDPFGAPATTPAGGASPADPFAIPTTPAPGMSPSDKPKVESDDPFGLGNPFGG